MVNVLECKNSLSTSDENRSPFSVKDLLGGPYWEVRFCSFLMIEPADFEDV